MRVLRVGVAAMMAVALVFVAAAWTSGDHAEPRRSSPRSPSSTYSVRGTTAPPDLHATFARTASVEILISRTANGTSVRHVPAVHRTVTGSLAAAVAYVADTLPVQIEAPSCLGYAPVNVHDTFVFRSAMGRALGTVDIGGCPALAAYLHTTHNDVALAGASDLDAVGLEVLGLPTSYGL